MNEGQQKKRERSKKKKIPRKNKSFKDKKRGEKISQYMYLEKNKIKRYTKIIHKIQKAQNTQNKQFQKMEVIKILESKQRILLS